MIEQPWSWSGPTEPFFAPDGSQPAEFVLAQTDDMHFSVREGFVYEGSHGRVEVSDESLVSTDLASIPWFMAWFVPVNGRHTPAALVHDQLVESSADSDARIANRADADDEFLAAMRSCEVALLRRNLMYAAVTLATRINGSLLALIGIGLWVLASLSGTAALVWSALAGKPWMVLAALLAPLAGGLLWGWRNHRQGMLAGYAIWVIALPALACIVAYGVYVLAEQLVRLVVPRVSRRVTEAPPPAPMR